MFRECQQDFPFTIMKHTPPMLAGLGFPLAASLTLNFKTPPKGGIHLTDSLTQ